MNDFDSLIEKYSRELVEAKRKSIVSEIEELEETKNEEENTDEFTEPDFNDLDDIMNSYNNEIEEESDFDSNQEEDLREFKLQNFDLKDDLYSAQTPQFNENGDVMNAPNTSYGSLKVQVFAADQVYPVTAANVKVFKPDNGKMLFQGYTDTSGIVDDISLPTPSGELSESPTRLKPYAQYDVTVDHPRFISRKYVGVPVFEGIKSVQTVQLVPTENGDSSTVTVTESEPNDLLLERQGNINA